MTKRENAMWKFGTRCGPGRLRAGTAGIVAAVAVLSLSGCANNKTALPPPSGPVLDGPKGTLKSPEQMATEQATAAIDEFYRIFSAALTDRGAAPEALSTVATAQYLGAASAEVKSVRDRDLTVTGVVRASAAVSIRISAPKSVEGAPIPGEATAEMRVCEDRSGLSTIGKDGVPVKDPAALPAELRRFAMVNTGWPGSGWVIVRQMAMPHTSCEKQF